MSFRNDWGCLFNSDEEVIRIVVSVLPLVALFQVRLRSHLPLIQMRIVLNSINLDIRLRNDCRRWCAPRFGHAQLWRNCKYMLLLRYR